MDCDSIKTLKLIESPNLSAQYGKGWHPVESSRPTGHSKEIRWTSAEVSELIVDSGKKNTYINLSLKYFVKNENKLSLFLNGKKIKGFENNKTCRIDRIPLKRGKNIFELRRIIIFKQLLDIWAYQPIDQGRGGYIDQEIHHNLSYVVGKIRSLSQVNTF